MSASRCDAGTDAKALAATNIARATTIVFMGWRSVYTSGERQKAKGERQRLSTFCAFCLLPFALRGHDGSASHRIRHFLVAEGEVFVRVGDVIALHQIDAELFAGLVLLNGLDAFGERLRAGL